MEKRKSIMLGMFFLTIFAIGFASATLTTISPASSSTISGETALLNASSNVLSNMLNCTWYAISVSTANNSFVAVKTQLNASGEVTSINSTFNSNILEDSNDYQFYSQCFNATANETSATNTGITIDNTIPQTPTGLSPVEGTLIKVREITFSSTVTGANTTGCTLNFVEVNPGSTSYTMTHSGNTCSHTLTNVPDQTFKYYITASDGTNSTNSAETSFNVKTSSGGFIPPEVITPSEFVEDLKGFHPIYAVLIIFVVLGILYFVVRKK